MSSDPSKTSGQYHSAKGSTKEGLGSMIGSEDIKLSGQQEHQAGQAELEAARAQGYTEGTKDSMGGLKDSTLGGITGDKQQQAEGDMRRGKGQAQQDINRNL